MPVISADGGSDEYCGKKRGAAFPDDEEYAVKLDKVVPFLPATTLAQWGAIHVPAPNWQANVVMDQRLVTGQNPASAEGVGREMARLLKASANGARP